LSNKVKTYKGKGNEGKYV